jgi:hypothetical protein
MASVLSGMDAMDIHVVVDTTTAGLDSARAHARALIARADEIESLRGALRGRSTDQDGSSTAIVSSTELAVVSSTELAVVSSSSTEDDSTDYASRLAAAQAVVLHTPARPPLRLGERDARAGFLPAAAMERRRQPKRRSDEAMADAPTDPTDTPASTAMVVHEEGPILPATKRLRLPHSAPMTAEDDGL